MISFKGRHFEREMILQSVRWYLAYSLSYRDIEEIKKGRMRRTRGDRLTPAEQFYASAA